MIHLNCKTSFSLPLESYSVVCIPCVGLRTGYCVRVLRDRQTNNNEDSTYVEVFLSFSMSPVLDLIMIRDVENRTFIKNLIGFNDETYVLCK